MAQSMPSGTNTFIPQMVQDNLIVCFSRKPEDFAVNRYCQIVPTPKNQAYYLYVDGSAAARLTKADLRNVIWPDGQPRPSGDNNVAEFDFKPIATKRHSYEFTIGQMAIEQADWPIVETNTGFQGQRAMTARTMSVHAALAAADWGSNTATATSAGGGKVTAGTAASPVFKKIVNAVAQQIRKATFGAVQARDICAVMSPYIAEKMSETEEIHTYLKESPFALAQIRGDAPSQNANYGLPDKLYGINIIVDDAYKVTSKRGATLASASVFSEDAIYFVSRPGNLVMPYGGVSFSTIQLFVREEMSVEMYPDTKNRITQGYVTDDYGVYVVAPASGYYVTDAI